MKQARDSVARLHLAEDARQNGEIQVATRILMTVARSRPTTPTTRIAQRQLEQLAAEAHEQMEDVNSRLASASRTFATNEKLGLDGPVPVPWREAVMEAFQTYDELVNQYDVVPAIQGKLESQVSKKRQRAEYATVLNEPEAAALCKIAREHEEEGQRCCAYWAYKDAAELLPAPAARESASRLAQMEQDPRVMESARLCRELRECHALYNRAESVVKTWPSRAYQLLAQVVERAPSNTKIHRAAQARMEAVASEAEKDPLDARTR